MTASYRNFWLLTAASLTVGCAASSGSRASHQQVALVAKPKPPLYSQGDGLSCETRVIVRAATEPGGLAAECNWLYVRYPGHKVKSESLGQCGDAVADIVSITTADGRELEIHFDISSFLETT